MADPVHTDPMRSSRRASSAVAEGERVAESATELEVARTLLRRAADRCDEVAVTGQRLSLDERAELKGQAAYVVELCRRATERLFAGAGAHGIYDDSAAGPFRDVNTAAHTPPSI